VAYSLINCVPSRRCHGGATENAGVENVIRAELQGLKMRE